MDLPGARMFEFSLFAYGEIGEGDADTDPLDPREAVADIGEVPCKEVDGEGTSKDEREAENACACTCIGFDRRGDDSLGRPVWTGIGLVGGTTIDGTCPLEEESERIDDPAFEGLLGFRVGAPVADSAGEEGRVLVRDGDIICALRDEPAGDGGRPLVTGVRD